MTATYQEPGRFTRKIFNPAVAGLTTLGISIWGSRVLESTGRTSGLPRRTPVNLLTFDGQPYLVAPRGNTQWVRNVRADHGRLTLILGRRRERWIAHELTDDSRIAVLRAYLKRWKAEVGVFFDGVGPDSSDDDLRRIADQHPAFRLTR